MICTGDKDAYVDLMLVHFPASWGGEGGAKMRVEEWKAMEAWQKTGKARALGKHVKSVWTDFQSPEATG